MLTRLPCWVQGSMEVLGVDWKLVRDDLLSLGLEPNNHA